MADVEHWNRPGVGAGWNVLKLGGKLMPGTVVEFDIDSELAKLDVKKAKGKQKAKQTNEGPENGKISIALQLESDEDLALLKANQAILTPTQERKPSDPLTIEYPLAALAKITTVVIEKVKWSLPDAVKGLIIGLQVAEWVQKPKESGGLGKKGKGTAPKTCAQKAAEAQAAWEDFAQTNAQIEALETKRASGVLLKSTEFAKLEQLKRRATQEHNIFLAAVATADSCKAAQPPSQSAKSNVI